MVFIARFSKIDVIGSSLSLNQLSSLVERSAPERKFLRQHGKDVKIFNLRGFLFFGSASGFFERIKAIYHEGAGLSGSFAVFNFNRVVGIDSTAAQVFVKLIAFMESKQIKPVFCGMSRPVAEAFETGAVLPEGEGFVFGDLDLALESIEERLLAERRRDAGPGSIHEILGEFLGERDKIERLVSIMDRLHLSKGAYLFHQGDEQTSFYVIESGTIEVRLEETGARPIRLREFRQGSILGEMAFVTDTHRRTASAVATEDSTVYRLEPDRISGLGEQALEYRLLLHELIARLLASRLKFMNVRTQADL
jgi:SulP family sulfate permease